jgi:HEAT repeat protein
VRFAITIAPSSPKPDGAAPETFYLATGAGTYEVTVPEDAWSHPGEAYDVTLPQPLRTSCVALVLGDAFTRGKAHPEVSVAELTAYSAFEVAGALAGGDERAQAAAALLERAGTPGILAMTAAYPTLDSAGRALAINVAASAPSCASSAPLLASALTDGDDVVRDKAATKLEEPTCGREALPALVDALKTPAARARVAPLVAFVGRERVIEPLAAVLGEGTVDERHAVRSAVAYASRRVPPVELSTLLATTARRSSDASLDLLRALYDRLAEVVAAADASVAPLVADTASRDTRYLVVDVVARLAATGDETAEARLADLVLRDASREVRAHAAELLGGVRDPALVAAKALEDPEPRVREAALRAVAAARQASLATAASEVLGHDPWTFVRASAADALAAMPSTPEADKALGDALAQLSPRVREESTLALGERRAKGYGDAILAHLVNAKEEPAVRAASARALGLLCEAKAADVLAQMAITGGSSADPLEVSLGLVATAALGTLHPPDIAARVAPLHKKGVRPDARAAADRAVADGGHCPLP